jgi:serine/threonine-protein kinase
LRDGVTISKLASRLGATEDAITSVIKGIFKHFSAMPEPEFEPGSHSSDGQPAIGDLFEDKYLIEDIAGKGGAGLVYRAQHVYMEREVAIKVLHSPLLKDPAVLTSFRQEAMAVACLEHPNIIRVYDFGVASSGFPYLVMEYAKAVTVREMLQSQPRIEPSQFFEIFIPICDALRSAHALNVIHCDLKPTNILIKQFESGLIPKLADFGLAKFVQPQEVSDTPPEQTGGTRVVEGTPPYMSPEQCLAEPLDQASDIYSLGCVMYEALIGRPVFYGKDAMETFHQHINKVPIPINRALHGVAFPPELEKLIDSMLKKERHNRIQTMDEVCETLKSLAPQ